MADATTLPLKKDVALALLDGPSMLVHIDPRRRGVVVPTWFKKQPSLVLQIGLNLAVPIRDLEVTDAGISCTLSFNRSPFWCDLPWAAVYALVGEDRRGMIWPDDVPTEISQQSPRASLKVVSAKKARKKADGAVDSVEEAPSEDLEATDPPAATVAEPERIESGAEESVDSGGRKLPPYLRVVK